MGIVVDGMRAILLAAVAKSRYRRGRLGLSHLAYNVQLNLADLQPTY